MKRSKENSIYWHNRIEKLFELDTDFKKTKKRYDTLKLLLQETYPHIKDHDNIQMLKDILYLDRELRFATQGEDEEEKQILSQEYQLQNGYTVGYKQDIKKLRTL